MPRSTRTGYVYIAKSQRTGLVKIGFSAHLATRLRSLCSAVGEPVELVAVARGDRATERQLLHRVAKHSISVKGNSEWHRPHPDLDVLIAEFPPVATLPVVVGPETPRKNAPRRPRAVVAAEAARLRAEQAERRMLRHKHGPGRVEGCALCRKELAQMAAWHARRLRPGDAEAHAARSAVNAVCALAGEGR